MSFRKNLKASLALRLQERLDRAEKDGLLDFANPNHCGPGSGGGRFTDKEGSTCESGVGVGVSGGSDWKSNLKPGPLDEFGKPHYYEDNAGLRWDPKGKPYPPSADYAGLEWFSTHGIDPEIAGMTVDSDGNRLFAPVAQGEIPPELEARYMELDPTGKALDQIRSIVRQEPTLILERAPVDDEIEEIYGGIVPQSRPNKAIKLNESEYSALETNAERAKERYEESASWTGEDIRKMADDRLSTANDRLIKAINESPEDQVRDLQNEHKAIKDARQEIINNAATALESTGLSRRDAKKAAKEQLEGDEEYQDALKAEKKAYRAVTDAKEYQKRSNKLVSEAESDLGEALKSGDEKSIARATTRLDKVKEEAGIAGQTEKERRIEKAFNNYKYALDNKAHVDAMLEKDPTGTGKNDAVYGPKSPKDIRGMSLIERAQFEAEGDYAKAEFNKQDYATKYAFPPGNGTAARVALIPDPVNQDNFRSGKGRVYLVMEGNLKAASVLSELKRSGELEEGSSIISVPSVTLWQTKSVVGPDGKKYPGELEFIANKYMQGREVVLIPDSDGVNNPLVVNQGNALKATLSRYGTGKVVLASPPLKESISVESAQATLDKALSAPISERFSKVRDARKQLKNAKAGNGAIQVSDISGSPSRAKEELKGVDDYIGVGRGALAGLQFKDRSISSTADRSISESIDSVYAGRVGSRMGTRIENAKNVVRAVSLMTGQDGTIKTGVRSIAAASGIGSPTTVSTILSELNDAGVLSYTPKTTKERLTPIEDPISGLGYRRKSFADQDESGTIVIHRNHRSTEGPTTFLGDLGGEGSGIRFVRTAAGSARYGLPIGARIEPQDDDRVRSGGYTGPLEGLSLEMERLQLVVRVRGLKP